MSKKIKNIFSDTACPSEEEMFKYASNQMKGEEKHAFERHLAGCAFCSEALEGLSLMEGKELKKDVDFLNKKIDGMSKPGKRIGYWPLVAAASVSLLLLTGTWFYLQNESASPLVQEIRKEEDLKNESLAESPVEEARNDTVDFKNQISLGNSDKEETITLNKPQSVQHSWSEPPQHMEEREQSKRQLSYYNKQEEVNLEEISVEEKRSDGSGYTSGEMRSSAPVSSAPVIANAKKDFDGLITETKYPPLQDMLTMVENEFPSSSGPVEQSKKKLKASKVGTFKSEAQKNNGLDDCPNCPKKTASEDAELDLVGISIEYALKKYHSKQYEQAHIQLEQIIKEDKNPSQTTTAKIYDALSLIHLNKTDEALKMVDPMIASGSPSTSDAAKWIKASILVNQKENSKAKTILEELSSYVNPYQSKAKEILKNIR